MRQVSRIRANACFVLGCVKLAWMCVNTWFTGCPRKNDDKKCHQVNVIIGLLAEQRLHAEMLRVQFGAECRTTKIYASGGIPLLLMQVVGYWLNEGLNEEK